MALAGLRRGIVLGLATKLRLVAAGMTLLVVVSAATTWLAYRDMSRVFFQVANEHLPTQYLIQGVNGEAVQLVDEVSRMHRADPLSLTDAEIEGLSSREAALSKRLDDLDRLVPDDPLIEDLRSAIGDQVAAIQSFATLRKTKTENEVALAALAQTIEPRYQALDGALAALEDAPSVDLLADIRATLRSVEGPDQFDLLLPSLVWRNVAALRAVAEARGHAALMRTALMSAVAAPDVETVDRLEADFSRSVASLQRIWDREAGRAMSRLSLRAQPLIEAGFGVAGRAPNRIGTAGVEAAPGVFALRRAGLERVHVIETLNQDVLAGTLRVRQGVSALVLRARQDVENATIATHRNLSLKQTLLGVFVLFACAVAFLFGWWFIGRRLSRRLRGLRAGAIEIAHGNYRVALDERGGDELAVFARAINALGRRSQELAEANREIRRLNRTHPGGTTATEDYLAAVAETSIDGSARNAAAIAGGDRPFLASRMDRAIDLAGLSSGTTRLERGDHRLGDLIAHARALSLDWHGDRIAPLVDDRGLLDWRISGDRERLAAAIADCMDVVAMTGAATSKSGLACAVGSAIDAGMTLTLGVLIDPLASLDAATAPPQCPSDHPLLGFAHTVVALHGGTVVCDPGSLQSTAAEFRDLDQTRAGASPFDRCAEAWMMHPMIGIRLPPHRWLPMDRHVFHAAADGSASEREGSNRRVSSGLVSSGLSAAE